MKYIWLAAGCLFLGFGLVGVVLPILPTTPFILVAVFCFAKSSERMHRWLLSTQLYQKHVKKFNETRTMTLKEKITILAVASVMLLAGFYFSKQIYARILIIIVMCIKYYIFIFKIKTAPGKTTKEMPEVSAIDSDRQN
ncbi:DUF454 domain-containing protein [Treponema vincentii]|uniref:YbaN family protein n=1 Tax=Treponema vincentii TaxID=69710 RepID=UPI0020A2CFB3|nr:YbaN family protein [Treponema vincentii]UTC46189.1 DUF454 domain-containing protein [Treponema vincentii]